MTIGIAVLTNGNRRKFLEQNIKAFIDNTSYRPLHFGIFNNGSTDDTKQWLDNHLPQHDQITFEVINSTTDVGCSKGVNIANNMVRHFMYSIFLESDWLCLTHVETGCSKDWLHECVAFLNTGKADYIFLRKFPNDKQAAYHGWHHYFSNAVEDDSNKNFLKLRFVYSNNPHIRNTQALYEQRVLPLVEYTTDKKGYNTWGRAEDKAKHPNNYYTYKRGLFVHETIKSNANIQPIGCNECGNFGYSGCKYGFTELRPGWCETCDKNKTYADWNQHNERFTHLDPKTVENMTVGIVSIRQGAEYSNFKSEVDWVEARREMLNKGLFEHQLDIVREHNLPKPPPAPPPPPKPMVLQPAVCRACSMCRANRYCIIEEHPPMDPNNSGSKLLTEITAPSFHIPIACPHRDKHI